MSTLCPTCGKPLKETEHPAYHSCMICKRFWTDDELAEAHAARVPIGTEQAPLFDAPDATQRYDPLELDRPKRRKPR